MISPDGDGKGCKDVPHPRAKEICKRCGWCHVTGPCSCGHEGPDGAVCELDPHPNHAHHQGIDSKGKRRRWKVCRGCGRVVGVQKRGGIVSHNGIPGVRFRCPGDVS